MQVSCRLQGPVCRIRLTAGTAGRTLLDPEGVAALKDVLGQAERASCRVLVLEGSAASFCEGLDLAGLPETDGALSSAVLSFAGCLRRVREATALVIACVDGACAGGGVGLAAAADVLLCTGRATFVLPEVVLGLLPAVVMPVLLERMPPQKARLLALGGGIDAGQALRLGLADRVVAEAAELEPALRALIKQALRSHPGAVSELKRLSTRMTGLELPAALEVGARRTIELLSDPERRGGLRAFLEGDPLPWFERYSGEGHD